MSVYTAIDRGTLIGFLAGYEVGELLDYTGISQGIENTNYFVHTDQGSFVLTVFEELTHSDLDFFLALMVFLAKEGAASAVPIADRKMQICQTLCNKPAVLVQRLEGHDVESPSVVQCQAAGRAVAHMHIAGQRFPGAPRAMVRGATWRVATAERVLPELPRGEAALLTEEMHYQALPASNLHGLPCGIIHADLFRDNFLFVDERLSGIIDFYYACHAPLIYDLAVIVNDWCHSGEKKVDTERTEALLGAYYQERPITMPELLAWPLVLRLAASRFWLSRLKDKYFPRVGTITQIKDPDVFYQLLNERSTAAHQTCSMWKSIVPEEAWWQVQEKRKSQPRQ